VKNFKIVCFVLITIYGMFLGSAQAVAALRVVAAENVYGELAKQLGGGLVQVRSILSNTNQDPHLFSATPSIAKAVADADVIIYNGLGYDDWMRRLIAVENRRTRQVIVIADLAGKKAGDNPHFWYDLTVMPQLAQVLTAEFKRRDPNNQKQYDQRFEAFQKDYQLLEKRIQELKLRFAQTPVIATEPVFDYMAASLGMQMMGGELQTSMMNHTAPSPRQLKQFEDVITQRQARALIYNRQVNQPLTERLIKLARQAGMPVVGITETQPEGLSYRQWMEGQLGLLEDALY
jgi:zinc/manganese transport system substrate-binding protein